MCHLRGAGSTDATSQMKHCEAGLGLRNSAQAPVQEDKTKSRVARAAEGRRSHVLVFDGNSSRVVGLPETGEVDIGRAPECPICLADEGVSRRHAKLVVSAGAVTLVDLQSHNGTRVNGQSVAGQRVLSRGDSIAISDCTLVLHCGPQLPQPRPVEVLRNFRQRLDAECERALRHERSFCVACLRFASVPEAKPMEAMLSRHLQLMDVCAWSDSTSLLVLLPEVESTESALAVEQLVESLRAIDADVRAGFSVFPGDGVDSDTLLLAARQATDAAKAGALESAAQCAKEWKLSERRTVLVADPAMARAYALLERLAKAPLSVLITGETGVGKENAAFAVHHWSLRSQGPFVSLNCAALPETLLESELFGYEKGAFSGASAAKIGLFEAGHQGTVFLDEVGELSASAQARLLRVLETKSVLRLGSVKEREVDLRVVAATNRDLKADVKSGKFREDLFFRLGAATVVLPPLRDRPREITLLAKRFLADACLHSNRSTPELSARAVSCLASCQWPGNVRELKNAMDYAAATAPGTLLEPWDFPESVSGYASPPPQPTLEHLTNSGRDNLEFRPLAEQIRALELRRIQEALNACGGVQTRAAELLGMPRRTFVLRLRELRVETKQ